MTGTYFIDYGKLEDRVDSAVFELKTKGHNKYHEIFSLVHYCFVNRSLIKKQKRTKVYVSKVKMES